MSEPELNETPEAAKPGPKLTIAKVAERLDKVIDSTNDAMNDLKTQIAESAETNNAILEMMKSQTKAVNTPVVIRSEHEAFDQDLGDVAAIGESPIITAYFDINSPQFREKASIEKFMHEMVTVHIHESNNDMEVERFFCSVNNKPVGFYFGETKTVPRYIVETLARAKPITYGNKQVRARDGSDIIVNDGKRGLRYPFSVLQDTEVGKSWLNCVLAQD